MMEMAAGDTDAVLDVFTEKIQYFARTLGQLYDRNPDDVFKELITTVKSTMTDKGATMPQFNERLRAIREDLLPDVVQTGMPFRKK